MKHLQSYNQFKVNEELDPTAKRAIMLIPNAILGFLGKKLLGIYPMLNLKWKEMKRATKGHHHTPLYTGSPNEMKHELEKITMDKLPPNSLKWAMFLRDWNVYLAKDHKSKGGGEYGKLEREVIYISKDEISKGDQIRSSRLSDSDIYPESDFIMAKNSKGKTYPSKLKDPANFPMVIMAVKYDELEKVKEVEQYVDDICLEIEDRLPVNVEPHFSKEQDSLSISIKIKEGSKLIFSEEISDLLTEVAERTKDYLKIEGYKFDYKIRWSVKAPFYYNGTAGRFGTEIIPAAEDYSWKNDENNPLWNRHYKTLDVSGLDWKYRVKEKLILNSDDLKTLLGDLDNCTKSNSLNTDLEIYPDRADSIKEKNKITQIELSGIGISFKRI